MRRFLPAVLLIGLIGMWGCGGEKGAEDNSTDTTEETVDQQSDGRAPADELLDEVNGVTEQPPRSSYDFKEKYAGVIDAYMKIKDVLANGNPQQVQPLALKFVEAVDLLSGEDVNGAAQAILESNRMELIRKINRLNNQTVLPGMRQVFSELSIPIIELQRQLGSAIPELYLMHCPNAIDNVGASWLSYDQNSLNPYGEDNCQMVENIATKLN